MRQIEKIIGFPVGHTISARPNKQQLMDNFFINSSFLLKCSNAQP